MPKTPTNNFFQYKKGKLFCEGVTVENIAKKVGTPFYLYSQSSFEAYQSTYLLCGEG